MLVEEYPESGRQGDDGSNTPLGLSVSVASEADVPAFWYLAEQCHEPMKNTRKGRIHTCAWCLLVCLRSCFAGPWFMIEAYPTTARSIDDCSIAPLHMLLQGTSGSDVCLADCSLVGQSIPRQCHDAEQFSTHTTSPGMLMVRFLVELHPESSRMHVARRSPMISTFRRQRISFHRALHES